MLDEVKAETDYYLPPSRQIGEPLSGRLHTHFSNAVPEGLSITEQQTERWTLNAAYLQLVLSAAAGDPLGFHRMAAMEFARAVALLVPKAAVYGKVSGGVLDLWVIVPERSHEVQSAIAEQMCDLMRAYPNLAFDFMVLDERSSGLSDASDSGYNLLLGG